MYKKILGVLCVSTMLFMAGCDKKENVVKKEDVVVAKYKNGSITKDFFMEELKKNSRRFNEYMSSDKEMKGKLFEQFVEHRLILENIKEEKYSQKISDELKTVEEKVLTQKFMESKQNEFAGKVNFTDQELKDYYEKNKKLYTQEEEIKASHILLGDTAQDEKDIIKIKKDIADKKITFEDAAKKYSKCPSGKNGGDLGFFGRNKMVKPFEDCAFGLKKGEVSEPVKTRFGYHIIKLTDKKEGGQKSFEEVKASIESKLRADKEKELFDTWKNEIMAKNTIVYSDKKDSLAKLNNEVLVTQSDVDNEIAALPAYMQEYYKRPENSDILVKSIAESKVIGIYAVKEGNAKDYQEEIDIQKEIFTFNHYMNALFKKKMEVSEDEIKTYFKDNNKLYGGKYLFLAKKLHKQEEIDGIIKNVESKIKDTDFDKLIKEYSDDNKGENPGNLGYFPKSKFPEFGEKIATLKVGENTGFIDLSTGYILVKLTGVKDAEYDNVKEQIRKNLGSEKLKTALEKFKKELHDKYQPELYLEKI